MHAVLRPRRPIRLMRRTRPSVRAISRMKAAVPSGESSSTKMISHSIQVSTIETINQESNVFAFVKRWHDNGQLSGTS
jgi:hypothetical protein